MSIIQQLKNEGVLQIYHDYRSGTALDWSGRGNHGVINGTPVFNSRGLYCGNVGNFVSVTSSATLELTTGCIIIMAPFSKQPINATYFYKRTGVNGLQVYHNNITSVAVFNGTSASSIAVGIANKKCLSVNFIQNSKPDFYLDGSFVGQGSAVHTYTTDVTTVRFGSGSATPDQIIGAGLYISRALTASEHAQVYAELSELGKSWPTVPSIRSFVDIRPKVPDNGLVAAWDFGQTVNSTCPDLTGGGKNLTVTSGCVNQSLVGKTFPLSTGNYAYSNTTPLTAGQSFSCVAVIKPKATATTDVLLDVARGTTLLGYSISSAATGNLSVQVYDNGVYYRIALPSLLVSRICTVTATYDFNAKVISVYIDGNFVSNTSVGSSVFAAQNAVTTYFGRRNDGFGPCLNNEEVKTCAFYNRALSAAEIKTLYESSGLKNAGWSTDFGSPVSTASRGGTTGQYLESTGWQFGSATPRYTVDVSTINGTAVKTIKCVTSGHLYQSVAQTGQTPTEAAYGTWEWNFNKGAAGNFVSLSLISDTNAALPTNGYIFLARATDNNLQLRKYPGGVVLINTANSYIANSTWYTIRITRSYAGVFLMYIRGGIGSAKEYKDWTTVGTATDATYTTSNFIVVDNDSSGLVSLGSVDGLYGFRKMLTA